MMVDPLFRFKFFVRPKNLDIDHPLIRIMRTRVTTPRDVMKTLTWLHDDRRVNFTMLVFQRFLPIQLSGLAFIIFHTTIDWITPPLRAKFLLIFADKKNVCQTWYHPI